MAGGKVTMRMRQQKSDRISSLPDVILCHILSFLPTKYSVRTRLLSTRWKYLFAFVPVLDFDNLTTGDNNNNGSRKRFIEFVNKVLMMYNIPHITKFCLVGNYTSSKHLDYFVSWIWFAVCRNVQELDISLQASPNASYRFKKRLPLDLFSCEKLSILKLDGPFEIKLLNSAFLPSLKTLFLRRISFDGNILSICPAVEDFLVDACKFGKVLNISHPILRKLRIVNCSGYELVLNAPSLVCFELLSSWIRDVRWVSDMTSLEKADIYPVSAFWSVVRKLVTLVSHARHLCLCTSVIEAFAGSIKALPTFHNLTCLKVGEVSALVFEVLPDLLNRCSLLEVLVFTEGFCCENSDDSDFDDYEVNMECYKIVPSCVSVHLKEVEFGTFRMQEAEWKLVEYFLRNAQVLKKMKIQPLSSCEKRPEFTKKLLAFPRFSRECQIVD